MGGEGSIFLKRVKRIVNDHLLFFISDKASTSMLMEVDMRGNIRMMISMGKVESYC